MQPCRKDPALLQALPAPLGGHHRRKLAHQIATMLSKTESLGRLTKQIRATEAPWLPKAVAGRGPETAIGGFLYPNPLLLLRALLSIFYQNFSKNQRGVSEPRLVRPG